MKKLKFAGLNFQSAEVLVKEELKKINGGNGYTTDYCGNYIGTNGPCGAKMCDTRPPNQGRCPSGFYIGCYGTCWS
jgi:hypothetical protein